MYVLYMCVTRKTQNLAYFLYNSKTNSRSKVFRVMPYYSTPLKCDILLTHPIKNVEPMFIPIKKFNTYPIFTIIAKDTIKENYPELLI